MIPNLDVVTTSLVKKFKVLKIGLIMFVRGIFFEVDAEELAKERIREAEVNATI